MAIVKMRHFSLLFPGEKKAELLSALQRFEQVHFSRLEPAEDSLQDFMQRDGPDQKDIDLDTEMARVRFALSALAPYDMRPTGLKALKAEPPTLSYEDFSSFEQRFDHRAVSDALKAADDTITAMQQESSRLKAFIEELRVWQRLDVSTAELSELRTVEAMFGLVSKALLDGFITSLSSECPAVYTENIGQIKEDALLLLLIPKGDMAHVSEQLRTLGLSRVTPGFDGLPSELLEKSSRELSVCEQKEAAAKADMKALAVHCDDLRTLLDWYETLLARAETSRGFLKSRSVVLCEGWVPADEADSMVKIVTDCCDNICYSKLEDVPLDSEDVPIKLKNNPLVSPFESIVEMYALPKYGEIDPTAVVAPFYTFFFGLMVGDMAYGLLLVLGTLFALKFLKLNEGARRFMQLFMCLGFGTLVGGALYGSFFGYAVFTPITMADGSKKAILDSSLDIVTMLLASVVLGVLHILFGIGVKGYMLIKDKKPLDALFDSGFWIITLISGIGYILALSGMLEAPYSEWTKWVFIAGIVGLALTQGRSSPSIAGKLGNGLYAVYGISSYVGDFVSYTRIAALALSGAYIAYSFNLMVGMFPGWSKFVVGGIVFALGQALNFGLAALGAYVHTCRLMYVEYFGKFYEGGGKPYRPLKLINKFVKVEK